MSEVRTFPEDIENSFSNAGLWGSFNHAAKATRWISEADTSLACGVRYPTKPYPVGVVIAAGRSKSEQTENEFTISSR